VKFDICVFTWYCAIALSFKHHNYWPRVYNTLLFIYSHQHTNSQLYVTLVESNLDRCLFAYAVLLFFYNYHFSLRLDRQPILQLDWTYALTKIQLSYRVAESAGTRTRCASEGSPTPVKPSPNHSWENCALPNSWISGTPFSCILYSGEASTRTTSVEHVASNQRLNCFTIKSEYSVIDL